MRIWLKAQIRIKVLLIIQFAIGMSLLLSTVTGNTTIPMIETQSVDVESQIIVEISEEHIQPKTTKEKVEEYFQDTPVLVEVARCESRFQQFDSNDQVLRGRVNRADVGVMQINEKYHAASAIKHGLDLYTLEGNLAYARYLYETQGTDPWVHSKKCWNSVREVAFAN